MKNRQSQTLFVMILISVSVLSASCSFKALTSGKESSERAVDEIHRQLNEEQYIEIYNAAHEEFRKASKEPDVIALFEAIHRKLGLVTTWSLSGFNINATPGGVFVTLNYNTQFVEGSATEKFIFKMNGDKAILCRYDIDSPTLITR